MEISFYTFAYNANCVYRSNPTERYLCLSPTIIPKPPRPSFLLLSLSEARMVAQAVTSLAAHPRTNDALRVGSIPSDSGKSLEMDLHHALKQHHLQQLTCKTFTHNPVFCKESWIIF